MTFSTTVDAAPLQRPTFERSADRTVRVTFPCGETIWQACPLTVWPLWQETRMFQQAFALAVPAVCETVQANPDAGLPSHHTYTLAVPAGFDVELLKAPMPMHTAQLPIPSTPSTTSTISAITAGLVPEGFCGGGGCP